MSQIKGQKEYQKFMNKEALSYKEAILAQCYVCNGQEDSAEDCQAGDSCLLYPFQPYSSNKQKEKIQYSEKQRVKFRERMAKARQAKNNVPV